jgi:serine/threonine-protein kinase CLA4
MHAGTVGRAQGGSHVVPGTSAFPGVRLRDDVEVAGIDSPGAASPGAVRFAAALTDLPRGTPAIGQLCLSPRGQGAESSPGSASPSPSSAQASSSSARGPEPTRRAVSMRGGHRRRPAKPLPAKPLPAKPLPRVPPQKTLPPTPNASGRKSPLGVSEGALPKGLPRGRPPMLQRDVMSMPVIATRAAAAHQASLASSESPPPRRQTPNIDSPPSLSPRSSPANDAEQQDVDDGVPKSSSPEQEHVDGSASESLSPRRPSRQEDGDDEQLTESHSPRPEPVPRPEAPPKPPKPGTESAIVLAAIAAAAAAEPNAGVEASAPRGREGDDVDDASKAWHALDPTFSNRERVIAADDSASASKRSASIGQVINAEDPELLFTDFDLCGEGASGSVWVCRHVKTGRTVAIKKMVLLQQASPQVVVNEIVLMARCDTPSIVSYYNSYIQSDTLWVVMEYVDGEDLTDVLTYTQLSEACIAIIAQQLLLGLVHIHEQSIMHRDIKRYVSIDYVVLRAQMD